MLPAVHTGLHAPVGSTVFLDSTTLSFHLILVVSARVRHRCHVPPPARPPHPLLPLPFVVRAPPPPVTACCPPVSPWCPHLSSPPPLPLCLPPPPPSLPPNTPLTCHQSMMHSWTEADLLLQNNLPETFSKLLADPNSKLAQTCTTKALAWVPVRDLAK